MTVGETDCRSEQQIQNKMVKSDHTRGSLTCTRPESLLLLILLDWERISTS